jgi:putative peptide zinc metalloprotease protein
MSDDDYIGRTFSDSWHRVAKVRVALRASVRAHRQMFRGQEWMVLRDALTTDWFRITSEAWRFVSRLSTRRTVEEVWMEMVERDTDAALSQEEVVQLLGHLNLSNLLVFDRSGAGASLFERYKKRTARERRALWMGFLSIRIPLIDPDRALRLALPLIRLCLSPMGALIYLLLLAVAGKTLIDHSEALFSQGAGLLAPSNLGLLYVGFIIAKVIHELGHAAVCRYFGGEVHKFGVMLLIFAPLPYVDATASWGFRKRGERLLTGSAGVLAELAVAAVAALIWAHTAPGAINAIAYNVIFVASVSSLLFNLNPLLRFDGYHMLVDLIDIPNLFQRSREQLKYLAERYLFRLPKAQPAARTASEAWLLPIYGVLSLVYWSGGAARVGACFHRDRGTALQVPALPLHQPETHPSSSAYDGYHDRARCPHHWPAPPLALAGSGPGLGGRRSGAVSTTQQRGDGRDGRDPGASGRCGPVGPAADPALQYFAQLRSAGRARTARAIARAGASRDGADGRRSRAAASPA